MGKLTMELQRGESWQTLFDSEVVTVCRVWGVPREPELRDGEYYVIIDDKPGCVAFFHHIDEIKWVEKEGKDNG